MVGFFGKAVKGTNARAQTPICNYRSCDFLWFSSLSPGIRKAVVVTNSFQTNWPRNRQRSWKMHFGFSGTVLCYSCQGQSLGMNWPRIREHPCFCFSEPATALLSSSEDKTKGGKSAKIRGNQKSVLVLNLSEVCPVSAPWSFNV